MRHILKNIERRRTETYRKLKTRFIKSLESGTFGLKSSRRKRKSLHKLRHLEDQLGIRSTTRLRHWAMAAALGLVTVSAQGQDDTERGKLGQKKKKPNYIGSQQPSLGESILGVQAVPIFTEQPFFSDSWISEEIFSGDFDGDGDQDMLTFGYYGPLRIFFNDSTGQFPSVSPIYQDVDGMEGIGFADVDGDGDLDVVVAEGVPGMNDDNNLFVLHNDGTGSFIKGPDQPQDSTDFDDLLQFADFDQDGDLDFAADVFIPGTGSRIRVFTNDGGGLFSVSDDITGANGNFGIGDFDGDGDVDIVFPSGGYNIRLQKNDSAAVFSGYTNIGIPYNANELVVGNIDGDGDLDIIFESNQHVVVMDNFDGMGNFSFNTIFTTYSSKYNDLRDIQLADMDGDADLDIFVAEEYNNFISGFETDSALFLENVDTAFLPTRRFLTTNVTEADNLTILDANGDANLDIIAHNYFDIVIYQNTGSLTFSILEEDLLVVVYGLGAAIVDVDGDGDNDVINSGLTQILKNDGLGNLTIFQDIVRDTDLVAGSVASGDFDGDGDVDAAFTTSYLSQPPQMWTNDGSGTFTQQSTVPVDSLELFYSVASGDMDGDGDLDLVGPGYNGYQGMSVLKTWQNDGSGNFALDHVKFPPSDLELLILEDFNGDTIPDVLTGGDFKLLVYTNLIDSLSDPQVFLDTLSGIDIENVVAGDIDGDGDSDFLAINTYYPAGVSFKFINNGSAVFTRDTLNVYTGTYGGAILEDFDLDGDFDLFLAGGEALKDELWENDGMGGFTLVGQLESVSYNPTAGDLDNDGDLDIFTNEYYQASRLIINNTNEPAMDTIPPVITLDTLSTNDNTPELTGGIDDAAASISVNIDGADYVAINNGDNTWTLPNDSISTLADGSYTVTLTATDLALNDSIVVINNGVIVDTMVPGSTINTISTNDNTPPLTGTIDDIAALITVTIDGNAYGATNVGDSTWNIADNTIAALADGFFDVVVTSTDPVGNVDEDTTVNAVFIDATPPVVTVDGLVTFDKTPELTGTIIDNTATISVDVSVFTETAVNNGDGTWTLTDNTLGTLALGMYDVAVTATDSLGNIGTDTTTNELDIIVDPGRALDSIALVNIYNTAGGPEWTLNTNWLTGTIDMWTGITVTNDRVTAIDLGGNNLKGSFPLISSGLDAVVTLDINDNELTSVASLAAFTGLSTVDVTNNRLQFDVVTALLAGPYTLNYQTQKEVLENQRQLLQIGELFVLDRTIAGADDYTWFKDGDPIAETTPAFTIATVAVEDDGIYTVEANADGVPDLTLTSAEIDLRVSSLERDQKSLRLVYNALDTENSTLTDWSTTTVQDWQTAGEVTITDNRVVSITVPNAGLTGVLTDDILDIQGLSTVDISGNDITEIPDVTSLSNLTSFEASDNRLDFGSIEPNFGTVTFGTQKPIRVEPDTLLVPKGDDVLLNVDMGGENNSYQWSFRNDSLPSSNMTFTNAGGNDASLSINDISYETMGQYQLEVTNSVATGITLRTDVQAVLAFGDIEFTPVFNYSDGTEGTVQTGESLLYEIQESGPYLGSDTVDIVNSTILHDSVKLGDYILLVRTPTGIDEIKDLGGGVVDTVELIPTYFTSTIDWLEADTLRLRDFLSESLTIQRVPPPTVGEGNIGMIVESDFDEGQGARLEARRRVKKAGCSLRRRRTTGGGRPAQDEEFDLIAYKETDDNGEVNFGALPDGDYRLNIQYPGVPMDPSSFIEFVIDSDGGIGGYELAATVREDGIVVEQVLSLQSDHFKDLNVYPVPADHEITIAYRRLLLDDVRVKLVSLDGRTLLDRDLETGNHKKLRLDVRDVESGVYLLQVYDQEGVLAKYKIIVRN